jgi:hypothetical protein
MVELMTVRLADLVSARLSDGRRVQSLTAPCNQRAKYTTATGAVNRAKRRAKSISSFFMATSRLYQDRDCQTKARTSVIAITFWSFRPVAAKKIEPPNWWPEVIKEGKQPRPLPKARLIIRTTQLQSISIPLAFRRPAASAVHAADFPASDRGRTARLSSPF